MSEMKKEDFLALIEKITNDQYVEESEKDWNDTSLLDLLDVSSKSSYHTKPSFRTRPNNLRSLEKAMLGQTGPVDFTKSTMAEIKENIARAGRVKIGKFDIQLKHSEKGIGIQIYENKEKNFGGIMKIMPEKINVLKDTRFSDKEWVRYFKNNMLGGVDIPIDTAADILKWIQVVFKFPAFL